MQGSVAVVPQIPAIMESAIFRQRLFGVSFAKSFPSALNTSNNNNSSSNGSSFEGRSIARCLFGSPDPQQVKSLVNEVELKNAITFGKRYNFDIVNGKPFPDAKKRRLMDEDDRLSPPSTINDSDEENASIVDGDEEEGYIWVETQSPTSSSSSTMSTLSKPNNNLSVSLLFAPSTQHANENNHEQPQPPQQKQQTDEQDEKKNQKASSTLFAKKSSHRIITKYTKQVLKHAVMKKPKTSKITDFLKMRRIRMSCGSVSAGVGKPKSS